MQELYNNFGRFGGFYSSKTRMWIQQYKWKKFPAITWDTATETIPGTKLAPKFRQHYFSKREQFMEQNGTGWGYG